MQPSMIILHIEQLNCFLTAKNDGSIRNNSALSSGNNSYFHNNNKMSLILREM